MLEFSHILESVVYAFLGVLIMVVSFVLIELMTPDKLWKEIIEKQNKALAIVAAAFLISIAIIIHSAIHG